MHRAASWIWAVFFAILALSCAFTVAAQSNSASPVPEAATEPTGELPAGSDGQQIPVGGSIKLDHLGPTIVSEDGQIKRIQNWDKLTKSEQDTAWRRIQKRNTERLEELRKKGEAGDRHDSTLGGFDEPATAEQRAAKADGHLKKFLAGLDKLKQQGQQVPGLDGLEDLLKDPRKDGKQDVDPKVLRQRLEELRKNTEKLRQQGFLRDEL